MQAEAIFHPNYLQVEIAFSDVRGFAEHCLAFAPVPSPIALYCKFVSGSLCDEE